jgi:hypothetical protein
LPAVRQKLNLSSCADFRDQLYHGAARIQYFLAVTEEIADLHPEQIGILHRKLAVVSRHRLVSWLALLKFRGWPFLKGIGIFGVDGEHVA